MRRKRKEEILVRRHILILIRAIRQSNHNINLNNNKNKQKQHTHTLSYKYEGDKRKQYDNIRIV